MVHVVIFLIVMTSETLRLIRHRKWTTRQECIPVGCVPPAVVAVRGGGLHQAPLGPDPPPLACEQNHRYL